MKKPLAILTLGLVASSLFGALPPRFHNLTPSQSIADGTPAVTLSGNYSGSIFKPAQGETITVTIDGNTQATTFNDSSGDFSINYDSSTIPYSADPYIITYDYNSAIDTNTTLTVTQASQPYVYPFGQMSDVSANNGTYHYTFTVGAAAGPTNPAPIDFFWYANGDLLPSAPFDFLTPAGWSAAISGAGHAIYYSANSIAYDIPVGGSLSGFGFSSTDTPVMIAGNSPIAPGTPVGQSYAYNQPANAAGNNFVVQFVEIATVFTSSGTLQITILGVTPGQPVVLQMSTNLHDWFPMQTNISASDTLSITNLINPAMSAQFFRALVP